MLIINAEIHTMDKKNTVIKNGYIGFAYGKILSLGSMNELNSITGEVIDAKGGIIYPGLIDAHTHLGMYGDSLTFEGDDCNEDTEPVTPHLRAIDAVNPMDRYFDEAVCAGVTSVITGPGSANPIAGQLAAVKTYGKRIDNMVIKAPVGIKFALGENPKSSYNDKEQMPVTRMATAALIREALFRARKYYRDRCNYENDRENFDEPEFDIKNDALLPLFKKEIPAHFHVHRADDIFTAVRIAKEFDIDYVLVHATEAHLVCDELKEEKMKLQKRQQIAEKKAESMKKYIAYCLQGEKFAPKDDVRVRVTYRKSETVQCADIYRVPDDYLRYKEPELDKTKVKKALKAGEKVEGCTLIEKQNIS